MRIPRRYPNFTTNFYVHRHFNSNFQTDHPENSLESERIFYLQSNQITSPKFIYYARLRLTWQKTFCESSFSILKKYRRYIVYQQQAKDPRCKTFCLLHFIYTNCSKVQNFPPFYIHIVRLNHRWQFLCWSYVSVEARTNVRIFWLISSTKFV